MANSETTINTGGGAAAGDVSAGRDFVGRDQTTITTNIILTSSVFGPEFINHLETVRRREQTKQQELERIQEELEQQRKLTSLLPITPDSPPITQNEIVKIQDNINKLVQKITELEKTITESTHFNWSNAGQIYLDRILMLYDRVRILGHSEDVPLGNIFTQVYILSKPIARQRHNIDELRKQEWNRFDFQRQPGQRSEGLKLVQSNRNLFILGKPGAGKTTFLKYIAIQAARQQLPRIPIFVALSQWADSPWGRGQDAALLPFIAAQFDICNYPNAELSIDYLLQKGLAIVLFDGLDEVKQEQDQRRRLILLLQNFVQKYDKSQYLITCRIAANDYAFANFVDVEVADFTPEQIQEYARKWFGDQTKKFNTFITELGKAENQGLAELCNTPLLLSLLCLAFDNSMHFPLSRAELYEDALETLLRRWDGSRQIQRDDIYRELSHKRKLQLLMNIAVSNFEKGELFFRQRDLERWVIDYLAKLPNAPAADTLDSTAILKAMEAQHSILVERAQGIYSFSHLTFQEYLTARYLAENQGRGVIHTLIHYHLTDYRWREVFLLTANLLDDANEFMEVMHRTIDGMLVDAPILGKLINWSNKQAQKAKTPVEWCSAIQLTYIFFEFALTRSFSLSLIRDNMLARVRDLAYELDITLDLDLPRSLALDLDRSYALNLNRNLNLDLKYAYKTPPLVRFDYGLYHCWAYAALFANAAVDRTANEWQVLLQQFPNLIEEMVSLASDAKLEEVPQLLSDHPIPSPSSDMRVWQQYANLLLAVLHDKRDLGHEWSYRDQEIEKLNNYLYANELLVQCLKVAAVTDRQAVLNNLLLPPAIEQQRIRDNNGLVV